MLVTDQSFREVCLRFDGDDIKKYATAIFDITKVMIDRFKCSKDINSLEKIRINPVIGEIYFYSTQENLSVSKGQEIAFAIDKLQEISNIATVIKSTSLN